MTTFIKTKFKNSDDQTNIDKYGLFGHNYQVATLSTLYITELGIILPSLKSIGKIWHT